MYSVICCWSMSGGVVSAPAEGALLLMVFTSLFLRVLDVTRARFGRARTPDERDEVARERVSQAAYAERVDAGIPIRCSRRLPPSRKGPTDRQGKKAFGMCERFPSLRVTCNADVEVPR